MTPKGTVNLISLWYWTNKKENKVVHLDSTDCRNCGARSRRKRPAAD